MYHSVQNIKVSLKAIQFKGRLYSKLSYQSVSYNKISKFVKNVSPSSKCLKFLWKQYN
jgi:hypothetical protein